MTGSTPNTASIANELRVSKTALSADKQRIVFKFSQNFKTKTIDSSVLNAFKTNQLVDSTFSERLGFLFKIHIHNYNGVKKYASLVYDCRYLTEDLSNVKWFRETC